MNQVIIRENGIFQRKKTIQIFSRKNLNDKMKDQKNNGKIFINELWSDKY